VIQYSETPVIEPKSRGVLDTPLSRGMTALDTRGMTTSRAFAQIF
jgi:hypothetical protein